MRGEKFSLQILTFLLNAFWRALWGLNVFLCLVLLTLASLFCVLQFVNEISVPRYFSDMVKSAVAEHGLIINFDSAKISLDGTVEISNVNLRFEGTPEPFFKAETARVAFWTSRLLSGNFELRQIKIFDGAIGASYAGAEKSPSISKIYMSLRKNGAWWNLDALNLRYGRLALELSGIISQTFSIDEFIENFNRVSGKSAGEVSSEKKDLLESSAAFYARELDKSLMKIADYKKYADMFVDPVLVLNFSLYGGEDNSISARLRAGEGVFNIKGREAKLENLEFSANYLGDLEDTVITTSLLAAKFSCAGLPSCDNFSARANLLVNAGYYALEDVDLSAKKISYEGMSIDNISLRKRYLDEENFGTDWKLFAAIDIYRLGGKFSFDKDFSVIAEFSGNLNPDWVLKRKEFAEIEELKGFSFANGINVQGNLSYKALDKIFRVRADVDAQDCVVVNIPIESVSATAFFDTLSNEFKGENVRIKTKEGWALNGLYSQNMQTHQYSIKLDGQIRPMAIASFMAPWWTRVMGAFEFIGNDNFPNADVSVQGTWGEPEFIWCFARASGAKAEYGGVEFDDFALSVWVSPLRITLYDMKIQSQDRSATGVIEWLYGQDGITTYNTQEIYLISTLNSAELIALGGEDAKDVLDIVQFSTPPQMTLNAVMQNPHHKTGKRDIFNVDAFAAGDTIVECAKLKNLRFHARSDKILTFIEKATCQFCQGDASGSLMLTKGDNTIYFKGDVDAQKMNQAQFFDFLASLGDMKKSDVATSGKDSQNNLSIKGEVAPKSFEKTSLNQNGTQGANAQSTDSNAVAQAAYDAHGRGDSGGIANPLLSSIETSKQQGTLIKSQSESSKKSFIEGGEHGEVTVTISLSGDVNNFEMCSGNGYANIENKELIRLNLFGALSRAANALHLPFGSFDITYASSSFDIKNGVVTFPRLEMGGAVMQIRGAASYNFIDDDIDSTLAILPFGGLSTPILSDVIAVINPITSAVQATIDGKISDPEIGINVNPINMLQSQRRILENIRSEF